MTQAAENEAISNFENSLDGWYYYGGWEFPGATGTIKADKSAGKACARLSGDFTGGGSYVALLRQLKMVLNLNEIKFQLKTESTDSIGIRVMDFSGQVHCKTIPVKSNGQWQEISVKIGDGEFKNHFAGADDGKWHHSVKSFSICLAGGHLKDKQKKTGDLWVADVVGVPAPGKIRFSSDVSTELGQKITYDGLRVRGGDKGKLQKTEFAGRGCYGTNKDANLYYLYFDVEDHYIYDTKDKNIKVKIEYFDKGNGSFTLQYDSQNEKVKNAETVELTDSNTWKKQIFTLKDAKFANRCNGDDFRLSIWQNGGPDADLFISRVAVKK